MQNVDIKMILNPGQTLSAADFLCFVFLNWNMMLVELIK